MMGKLKRVIHFVRNAKCYVVIGEQELPLCGGINCVTCGRHDHRTNTSVLCMRCELKAMTRNASLGYERVA